MQKKTKFSIIFIIIILLLGTVAFIFAGKWTKEFQEYLLSQGSLEYAKAHDIVITETKDGIKYWEIYAAVGEYDTNKVQATLTDIVGNYYQKGEVVMSFTAPNGVYNSEKQEVSLSGFVRIVGKDDAEVTADKISWVTTEDIVKAEGNVIINKANELIALSDKATLTTDFVKIEIIENAEVRVYKELKNKRGLK